MVNAYFAIEARDRRVYFDPEAQHHGDVAEKFGINMEEIVSRGWVIGGRPWPTYLFRAMRPDELIGPDPQT